MSTVAKTERAFPLFPLLGAGTLILVSLLSVAWVRWSDEATSQQQEVTDIVKSRSLYFSDQPSGEVDVLDASTGALLATLPVGEHGFIRSTLRGLARARRARGIGAETPFVLQRRANGQLLLIDPDTEQVIDLWAFGAVNATSFADFLDSENGATNPSIDDSAQQVTMHRAQASPSVEGRTPNE